MNELIEFAHTYDGATVLSYLAGFGFVGALVWSLGRGQS